MSEFVIISGRKLKKTTQGYKIPNSQIHIRHRPRTVNWECAVYQPNQKKYKIFTAGTEDLEQAVAFAFDWKSKAEFAAERGLDMFPKKTDYIAEKFIEFMNSEMKKEYETKHMVPIFVRVTKSIIIPYFGKYDISSLDKRAINRFIDEYMARTGKILTKTAIIQINMTLRKILSFAKDNGWHNTGEAPQLRTQIGTDKECRDNFTDSEIAIMLGKIDEWVNEADGRVEEQQRHCVRFIVHLMLASGCRTNDFGYLRWKHFKWYNQSGEVLDFKESDLIVDGKVIAKEAVNGFPLELFSKRGKTKGSDTFLRVFLQGKKTKKRSKDNKERTVACDQSLSEPFKQWKEYSGNPGDEELVIALPSRDGSRKVYFFHYSKVFNNLLEYCGIPKFGADGKVRVPYSLRHTFITNWLKKTNDPFFIATQCGTSVKQIKDTYSHLLPEDLYGRIFKQK